MGDGLELRELLGSMGRGVLIGVVVILIQIEFEIRDPNSQSQLINHVT